MSNAVKESPARGPAQANGQAVAPAQSGVNDVIQFKPFGSEDTIKLSVGLILKYHCRPTKSGKVCSQEQAMRFLMLCKSRLLNPWEGDAYLVGFDSKDGPEFNLVTAHQAFIKRAEAHPMYDGMESGVLVVRGAEVLELQGDFYNGDDVLVGGWAKVYRKDRGRATYRRLKLATFDKGFGRWNVDKAGMIVKCAEGDALRSTFPNVCSGMYLAEELDDRPAAAHQRVASVKSATPAIANDTHTPRELMVHAEPAPDPEPTRQLAEGEVPNDESPVQAHARAIEEADTPADIQSALTAVYDDSRVPKGDRARLRTLADQRLAALRGAPAETGDPDADPFKSNNSQNTDALRR